MLHLSRRLQCHSLLRHCEFRSMCAERGWELLTNVNAWVDHARRNCPHIPLALQCRACGEVRFSAIEKLREGHVLCDCSSSLTRTNWSQRYHDIVSFAIAWGSIVLLNHNEWKNFVTTIYSRIPVRCKTCRMIVTLSIDLFLESGSAVICPCKTFHTRFAEFSALCEERQCKLMLMESEWNSFKDLSPHSKVPIQCLRGCQMIVTTTTIRRFVEGHLSCKCHRSLKGWCDRYEEFAEMCKASHRELRMTEKMWRHVVKNAQSRVVVKCILCGVVVPDVKIKSYRDSPKNLACKCVQPKVLR